MCEGLGTREEFDPELILGDETHSLADRLGRALEDRLAPRKRKSIAKTLARFPRRIICDWTTPSMPTGNRRFAKNSLRGEQWRSSKLVSRPAYATGKRIRHRHRRNCEKEHLAAFRGQLVCPACGGARIRPEARNVRIGGKAIHEIAALSVEQAREFSCQASRSKSPKTICQIYEPLAVEINNRLAFLDQVGLGYLTLDRPADTLSGGELQRVRLATGIGSGLVGVCYVLDEPSIGLHPRDNQRLIDALRDLQQQGNTVLVVEHDEAMMRACDQLIDLGPGAGAHGGRIVAQGTPAEVAATRIRSPAAISPASNRFRCRVSAAKSPRPAPITLEGVTTNNLQNVTARFPLGRLHLRHRRQRLRQKLARQRNTRPRPRPPPHRHGP